ncbi:MAG: transglycosylase domain-containing protein [Clostridia bacterium]|nr:transglycosylase domain-containing protein [Clostridia bacterium]
MENCVKKAIKKFILLLILVISIAASVSIYNGYIVFKTALEEQSIAEKISSIKSKNPNYTIYSEIPQRYIDAVISVEDRRFFSHKGIDIISILRAIYTDITTFSLAEGGSTITQQLAKNIYFTQKKEMTRKIAEVFMAIEIEKNCSKEQIFELYVNTIYYGDGYYCIYDASMGYFNKKPSNLDLYECTLLAGIPNAPSIYSPNANATLSKQRHRQVINKMIKYKYITKEEADEIFKRIIWIPQKLFYKYL